MRHPLVKTLAFRLPVLICLLATLLVLQTSTAGVHFCPDASQPVCEQLDGDDVIELSVATIPTPAMPLVQTPLLVADEGFVLLHLSPNIFQPPELA